MRRNWSVGDRGGNRRLGGPRVLGGVGQGLRDDEVGGGLRRPARRGERAGDLDRYGHRAAGGQRGQGGIETAVGEDGRVDAAHEVTQLGQGLLHLAVRVVQRGGRLRVAGGPPSGRAELHAEGDQALLRAVVQVALDPATLLVGGTDRGRARLRQDDGPTLRDVGPGLRRADLLRPRRRAQHRPGAADQREGRRLHAQRPQPRGEDRREPQHRDRDRRAHGVAVERDEPEQRDGAGQADREDHERHGEDQAAHQQVREMSPRAAVAQHRQPGRPPAGASGALVGRGIDAHPQLRVQSGPLEAGERPRGQEREDEHRDADEQDGKADGEREHDDRQ